MAKGSETAIPAIAARERGRGLPPNQTQDQSQLQGRHSSPDQLQGEGEELFQKGAVLQPGRATNARAAWKPLLLNLCAGLIVPAVILAAWQLAAAAAWLSPTFMPAPSAILNAFFSLAGSGELAHHLGGSLQRTGVGFLLGGLLGVLLGLLAGGLRTFSYLVDPSLQLLRLVPHLAIAPLIILWFGFGEVSKIAIIISGSFFPLYLNTFTGMRQADARLLEVGQVLGFTPLQKLKRIILPAALPNMLLGVRLSLGAAWIGLVVAELIGSQSGVGFLINNAKQNDNTELIFVGIALFAVAGKLIDSAVRLIERRLLGWRDNFQG